MGFAFVHRLMFGLLLVGLGVVLLLNMAGAIRVDVGELLSDYWPLVLIYYFGVRLVFRYRTSSVGSMIWNLAGLFFGFYFLSLNMDWIDIGFGDLFTYAVPVALIVIGLSMILLPKRGRAPSAGPAGSAGFAGTVGEHGPARPHVRREHPPGPFVPPHDPGYGQGIAAGPAAGAAAGAAQGTFPGADGRPSFASGSRAGRTGQASFGAARASDAADSPHRPRLQRSSLFGDHYIGGEHWKLEPIGVSTFVGDTYIDLTGAEIPSGDTRINVSTLIGDVSIRLPDDPEVDVAVVASLFFGGAAVLERTEGGLLKSLEIRTPDYGAGRSQLRIHVSVLIGDVEIKRSGRMAPSPQSA